VAAFIVQGLDGVALTSLAEELGRELPAISQAAGRLDIRMKEAETLRQKAEKAAYAINAPNCRA